MKRQYRFWLMGVVALVVVLAMAFTGGNPAGPEQTLALQPPAFVEAASEESSRTPEEIAVMLSDEAGISAYFQDTAGISLDSVRGVFHTIEIETADYIVGSVPVPTYLESEDTHVYVNEDGWVLAYYLNNDPISKMIDTRTYRNTGSLDTTKLKNVLSVVAAASGSPFSEVFYYDFRYPNATNMMLIGERLGDGDGSFTINMPSAYGYYERGLSAICDTDDSSCSARVTVKIDGQTLVSDCWYCYDSIPASQFMPDTTHTISLYDHGWYTGRAVIIIVYRVP